MFDVIGCEPRYCVTHGDYTCNFVHSPIGDIATRCPKCTGKGEDIESHRHAMIEAMRKHDDRMVERRKSDAMIPERYLSRTLDNYRTETEGQAKAMGHCRTFADSFKNCQKTGGSLFMAGNAGAGKTHLACAIANQLIERGHTALFLGVSKMFRRIRATYRADSCQSEQDAIDELVRVDLLIIDEVGVQRGTESEEQLLFEVLNDRYGAYKPTILISNLPLDQARAYIGTRTLDRLRECGGKLIVFDWDSYRGRVRDDAELPAGSGVTVEPMPPSMRPFPEDD